ncbi:MAG: ABC transporter permease [Oscillospiraceae bacterium]|nr:ABC transporter permease [Oscillospiraceae bacterium]
MVKYVLKRMVVAVPVFFGITFCVFALVMSMPGDPFSGMLDPSMTAEYKRRLLEQYGLNDPFLVQYGKWLGRVIHGDLGYSTAYKSRVLDIIGTRIGNTALLGGVSLIISTLIGIPAGISVAMRRNSLLDAGMTIFCFFGVSVPAFFMGMLLILLFGMTLKWLPISGMVVAGANNVGLAYALDVARHMVMPATVLSLLNVASFMRYTRSSVIDVLGQDYIRTARSNGVPRRSLVSRHILKNALIPIITVVSLQIPSMLSGALLTETVFVWPGIGQLNYQAVLNRDYQLIMGIVLVLALVTLLVNIIADICYAIVDPRIRYS